MKRATIEGPSHNRFGTLARRPGGVPRHRAIAQAAAAVEKSRVEGIKGIQEGIRSIEALASVPDSTSLTVETMQGILGFADRIITLAGTFQFQTLSVIAMRLCDLTAQLIAKGRGDTQAVRVFVRALRLVAPPSPALAQKDSNAMTRELMLVLRHYGVDTQSP